MGKYILVNHLQTTFTQALSEQEREELIDKTNQFIASARPHVDGVIFAFCHDNNPLGGKKFNLAEELPKSYQEGDILLRNDGGKGQDNGFLEALEDLEPFPENVILTGLYFDACIKDTGMTIRKNIGGRVIVPNDLVDKPGGVDSPLARPYAKKEMREAGLLLGRDSEDVLEALKGSSVRKAEIRARRVTSENSFD